MAGYLPKTIEDREYRVFICDENDQVRKAVSTARGPQLSVTGTIADPSADTKTDGISVAGLTQGAMQVSWDNMDAFNSTIILQGSNDDTNWNDLGGASGGITLDDEPDTQVWEFTQFTTKYIRISYKANNVTTADLDWGFEGS